MLSEDAITIVALRAEVQIHKRLLADARAEVAALREALSDIAFWRCGCGATWASDKAKQALAALEAKP